MSPFIISYCHWLTYLSSIAVGFTVNLSATLRDRSIFILAAYPAIGKSAYPACSAIEEPAYQLHNWSTHIPAACSVMEEPAYLLATQLANLHISCDGESAYQLRAPWWRNLRIYWPLNWPIYISVACSAMGNLPTSYTVDQSTYWLHTPWSGDLSIGRDQSMGWRGWVGWVESMDGNYLLSSAMVVRWGSDHGVGLHLCR